MQDLIMLRLFPKPQPVGCQATGGRVLLFYPESQGDGEKPGLAAHQRTNRKDRDRREIVDFLIVDLKGRIPRTQVSNQQSKINNHQLPVTGRA
jgi:hypothetical protein